MNRRLQLVVTVAVTCGLAVVFLGVGKSLRPSPGDIEASVGSLADEGQSMAAIAAQLRHLKNHEDELCTLVRFLHHRSPEVARAAHDVLHERLVEWQLQPSPAASRRAQQLAAELAKDRAGAGAASRQLSSNLGRRLMKLTVHLTPQQADRYWHECEIVVARTNQMPASRTGVSVERLSRSAALRASITEQLRAATSEETTEETVPIPAIPDDLLLLPGGDVPLVEEPNSAARVRK